MTADPSLLAADIGNSHTVLGLVRDGEVSADWRVATVESRTADEWAVLIRGLLGDLEERGRAGSRSARRCPSVLQEWRTMLADHFGGVPSVVVEPGVRTGVPVLTDNPREVGTDRIVNALAAATRYGGPAVVVDFGGTATTFDVVNARGPVHRRRHIAGHRDIARGAGATGRPIAHGRIAAAADGDRPEHGRGAAVGNGVRGRQPGRRNCRADDRRSSASRRPTVSVVATGYLAPLVVDECRCFTAHEPWLTLRGPGAGLRTQP